MHNAELITRTNAVKSLSDGAILVCSRVCARFLHGFCTVTQDAQVDFRCKIRQGVHKLYAQKLRCFALKWRYDATSMNWDMCYACAFNQRARDSSSLERTKRTINRWIKRFVVFFVLYGLFGLVPVIFSKILEIRGTKMKKIQKNYELNAGESFRLESSGDKSHSFRNRAPMAYKTKKPWNLSIHSFHGRHSYALGPAG